MLLSHIGNGSAAARAGPHRRGDSSQMRSAAGRRRRNREGPRRGVLAPTAIPSALLSIAASVAAPHEILVVAMAVAVVAIVAMAVLGQGGKAGEAGSGNEGRGAKADMREKGPS
jgi:hypothetical protein